MRHRYSYAEKNCLFSMPSDLLLLPLSLHLKSHIQHNFWNIMKETLEQLNPLAFVYHHFYTSNITTKNIQKKKKKKGKRKIKGVLQVDAAALPRHQDEEETDKTIQAQI